MKSFGFINIKTNRSSLFCFVFYCRKPEGIIPGKVVPFLMSLCTITLAESLSAILNNKECKIKRKAPGPGARWHPSSSRDLFVCVSVNKCRNEAFLQFFSPEWQVIVIGSSPKFWFLSSVVSPTKKSVKRHLSSLCWFFCF